MNDSQSSLRTTIALGVSIVIFIPAALIFFSEYFEMSESHPLMNLFFPVIFITWLPELPLHRLSQAIGFPVVLPSVVFILTILDFLKGNARRTLSTLALALTIVAILLHLSIRFLL